MIDYKTCYSFLDVEPEINGVKEMVQAEARKLEILSKAYNKSSKRYSALETKNRRLIAKNEYLTKYIKKTDPKQVIKSLIETEDRIKYLSGMLPIRIEKETIITEVSFYLRRFPKTRERCLINLISAYENKSDKWWKSNHNKTLEEWRDLLLEGDE